MPGARSAWVTAWVKVGSAMGGALKAQSSEMSASKAARESGVGAAASPELSAEGVPRAAPRKEGNSSTCLPATLRRHPKGPLSTSDTFDGFPLCHRNFVTHTTEKLFFQSIMIDSVFFLTGF